MSVRKYTSLTIFWTLPLRVDRTYTLLEILDERESPSTVRFKLVMAAEFVIRRELDAWLLVKLLL